ncbi:hypothetical protein CXB51_008486 [Gossypium anomalum]|uniref:Uncharacterized protein n=1 Tax=Gossypium anomalum TaxID=47600 RepID=A0A8J6D6V6_9ROSI|nr:hypothetical protein CXB51_008486 [Gossypium anomalum]
MEILKKGGRKAMGVPDEPMIMGTPGLDLITLGLVDADKIPKYELTVEDGRRLAKEYSRVLMRKHRARQAAETNLLRMKKEAIEALPEKLKEAAMRPDLAPFPANRLMASLTPPIEGYIEKVKEAAKKSSTKQKLSRQGTNFTRETDDQLQLQCSVIFSDGNESQNKKYSTLKLSNVIFSGLTLKLA